MAYLNKVMIMGNVGQNLELRKTSSGRSVVNISIATTQRWKDEKGAEKETTEWHKVIVWGKLAENCGKYLSKGRGCFVEGRLQTRKYEKDGQDHYSTQIIADNVQFLTAGGGKEKSPRDGDIIDAQARTIDDDPFGGVPF